MAFAGLPKDFFAFFRELEKNNERGWFEDNKQRYRDHVQAPLSEFVSAMAPELRRISRHFVCDPRPNGGSMFRIHRDVRFARDKRPYKQNAGCFFRHDGAKDVHAPGFYMHFAPQRVFFGGGSWHPEAAALARIRAAIAEKPAAWKKVGEVHGEALTRAPRGFDPAHPFIDDIRRKSFFAMRESSPSTAQSPALVGEVAAAFRSAAPLMKFLCAALEVPF